jgi:hypothetical protein
VVAPLTLNIAGYFPGKHLRKVGDLPRGVMEQWRRWCLNREYPPRQKITCAMSPPRTSASDDGSGGSSTTVVSKLKSVRLTHSDAQDVPAGAAAKTPGVGLAKLL